MPEFSVRIDQIERIADETREGRRKLDLLTQECRDVARSLRTLTQMEHPLRQLGLACGAMEEQSAALTRMSSALDAAAGLYLRAERQICREAGGGAFPRGGSEAAGASPFAFAPAPPGAFPAANTDEGFGSALDQRFFQPDAYNGRQELFGLAQDAAAASSLACAAMRGLWWDAGKDLRAGATPMLGGEVLDRFRPRDA